MWGIECVISSLFLISKNMEQSKFDADLAIKGETTARSAFNLGELETLARIDKEKGNDLTANDVFRVVKEHEADYKKVLAEVNTK